MTGRIHRRQMLAGGLAACALRSTAGVAAQEQRAPGPPPGYGLVFADEFDSSDLGRINEEGTGGRPGAPAWRSRYRHARKDVINQEKQIYMDAAFAGTANRPLGVQPFRIADSVLEIRAAPADPQRVRPFIWNQRYTSGCISTERSHAQCYGYVEVRARLPRGRGFWPAFWLLPTKVRGPQELDILEASGARPSSIWNNVHGADQAAYGRRNPSGLPFPGRWFDGVGAVTESFHTYALDWTPERLTFLFDGAPTAELRDHGIHDEMYFLANLAVGSHDPNWIPDPDDTTPWPGVLAIDHVRFYARA